MKRKIVLIDQVKCNGCGECVPSCAEGAIQIINGKAVLSADNLCDGLGACLGNCPQNAITIIQRDAEPFHETVTAKALKESGQAAGGQNLRPHAHENRGCPGAKSITLAPAAPVGEDHSRRKSQLGQWPVQLTLVPAGAPYFQDADLLITADCVPLAYPDYHRDFLAGKAVAIGCPKQPDAGDYVRKLTDVFRRSTIKSVTVLRMEVPCCGGIVAAAKEALAGCGKEIPLKVVTIGISGDIK